MERALLVGPLRFTPVNEERQCGYAFEGSIALDRLVSGVIELVLRTGVASPMGASDSYFEVAIFGDTRRAA